MSSIPGGGVTITFVEDRSRIDAYLAELRSNVIRVPVQADFIGPGGGGAQGPSAAQIASQGGPATFSNRGGSPVYGNGPSGTFSIAGAGMGLAGPGMGIAGTPTTYGTAFTIAPGGGAATPAATAGMGQLQQTMTQLNGAINQLAQAFTTFAATPPNTGGGNNPSPGNPGANRRGYSLGRYLAYGFLTREALNIFDAGGQYNIDAAMSNGQPGGMLDAEMSFYNRVSGVPIFGQMASLLADPGQARRLEIASLQKQSSLQDQFSAGSYGYSMFALSQQRNAELAQLTGPAKMREQAEYAYQNAVGEANDKYAANADILQKKFAAENAVISDRFRKAHTYLNPSMSQSNNDAIDSQHQAEIQKRAGELKGQLDALEKTRQNAYESATKTRAATLMTIGLPAEMTIANYAYESDIAREQSKPFINVGKVRQLQTELDKVQRDEIGRDRGWDVADAWYETQTEQRNVRDDNEDRRKAAGYAGAYGAGRSALQRAFGHPFAAAMTDLMTDFKRRGIENRDPSMVLPNFFEFIGRTGQMVGDAYRSWQENELGIVGQSNQLAAMIQHNPLGAEMARIQAENQQAKLQYARMPGGNVLSAGADALASQQYAYARQEDYIHFSRAQIAVQAQTRSFDIQARRDPRYGGAQPGELPLLARIQEFTDDTRGAERDAMLSGHPELMVDLARRGRSGLSAMQASYMRGFQAQEMDPMLTALSGPGTFSGGTINKAFSDAARDIGSPARTDAEDATLKRIETALHQLLGPVMNWLNAGG